MNGLREILEFVGLSGPNKFIPGPGELPAKPTMRGVGTLVSVLGIREQTSLRAMIPALQNLPPINLEIEVEDNTDGEAPPIVGVNVHPSSGVIISTVATV